MSDLSKPGCIQTTPMHLTPLDAAIQAFRKSIDPTACGYPKWTRNWPGCNNRRRLGEPQTSWLPHGGAV